MSRSIICRWRLRVIRQSPLFYPIDADGQPDFDVRLNDGRRLLVECKTASQKRYSNGDFKVEAQKTRDSGAGTPQVHRTTNSTCWLRACSRRLASGSSGSDGPPTSLPGPRTPAGSLRSSESTTRGRLRFRCWPEPRFHRRLVRLHDGFGDALRQERWYRVSDLSLYRHPLADEGVVVREREESPKLRHTQPTILPVERSDVGARLCLDRRGWSIGVELEQERPVARTPLEDRVWVAEPLREVQVVPAWRNLGSK